MPASEGLRDLVKPILDPILEKFRRKLLGILISPNSILLNGY